MLACAQESIYTKAKTGKMKQKTLAQVCQQCHGLYADVAKCAERLSKVSHRNFISKIAKFLGSFELRKIKSAIFQSENGVASSATVQGRQKVWRNDRSITDCPSNIEKYYQG